MNTFIDCETIPDQSEGAVKAIAETLEVKVPALTKPELVKLLNYTGAAKDVSVLDLKTQWLNEFGELDKLARAKEQWLKTSFNGGYGELCAVCIDIDDAKASFDNRAGEREMVRQLWMAVTELCKGRPPFFIAHNADFDIQFLYRRSVVLGVKPPQSLAMNGRHGQHHYCTMKAWAGHSGRVSLDELAKILGVGSKTEGMDGSKVWPEYQAGNLDEIVSYCADDVALLKRVYNRLNFADYTMGVSDCINGVSDNGEQSAEHYRGYSDEYQAAAIADSKTVAGGEDGML